MMSFIFDYFELIMIAVSAACAILLTMIYLTLRTITFNQVNVAEANEAMFAKAYKQLDRGK